MLLSLGLLTAGAAPRTFTAELPATQSPADNDDSTLNLPDSESVTVRNSDRELVLTWPSDDSTADNRTIRLVRVSDDGVEPQLWRIVTNRHGAAEGQHASRREVEWIFAFLSQNSKVIDRDGIRHSHPGLMRLSHLYEKEHESCVENSAA